MANNEKPTVRNKAHLVQISDTESPVSRESGEEDLGAAGLLRRGYSAGPLSQTCFT